MYEPATVGQTLANGGSWGQSKVQAHLDGRIGVNFGVARHGAVFILWPDGSTFLHIGVFATSVAADPIQVFTKQHLLVVAGWQVVDVLSFGV